MALLVINAPFIAGNALVLFLAGSFALDAIGHTRVFWRSTEPPARMLALLGALGDAAACALLLVARQVSVTWLVAIAAALRCFGVAWTMATTPVHQAGDAAEAVVDDLDLDDDRQAATIRDRLAAEEKVRAQRHPLDPVVHRHAFRHPHRADAGGWVAARVCRTGRGGPRRHAPRRADRLHVPRAGACVLPIVDAMDRAPGVAATAAPRHGAARLARSSRRPVAAPSTAHGDPAARSEVFGAGCAQSLPRLGPAACRHPRRDRSGLGHELVFRHRELGSRDVELVGRVADRQLARGDGPRRSRPDGSAATRGDLRRRAARRRPAATSRFIVIGDTGEGDASQHVLRDQLLAVASATDVRFVVISSDVVYPNGSMIDYEAKFWLPFKGVTRPVYAIPGNHDWYDALEAFLATFLQADAARTSIRARAEADLRLTSTTDGRIDEPRSPKRRGCASEYGVPTGFQRGPFFEVQTDRFALIAIDTGIVQADRRSAVGLARGSARTRARQDHDGGRRASVLRRRRDDTTAGRRAFSRLKQLLSDHGVTIMMAGDTHDLEYYAGARDRESATPLLRQRRRRRISELRHRSGLAGTPATVSWAYYPDRRRRGGQDSRRGHRMEAAGVVVDASIRRVAVLRGVALGGIRLQRRAVLSELCRSAGRTILESDPDATVRRARAPEMARPCLLGRVAAAGSARRRFRGMERSDAMIRDQRI